MYEDFLSIADLSKAELLELLESASALKKGVTGSDLAGKHFALLFEKPSLRTKASFEVGIRELGGEISFFGVAESGRLGERESVRDFAQVLSGYFDGIVIRVFDHAKLIEFARESRVPVINALSNFDHPCQVLADLFTIQETLGRLTDFKLTYLGDGNNVARGLAIAAQTLGFDFALAAPTDFWLEEKEFVQTEDLAAALKGADIVYTDTWVSMGDEAESAERKKALRPYQLNSATLALAKPTAKVLHCLPAHRGQEITDQVIDSAASLVYAQAANRLPVQKAVLKKLCA